MTEKELVKAAYLDVKNGLSMYDLEAKYGVSTERFRKDLCVDDRVLVIYNRDFVGYGDGDLNGADYDTYLCSAYLPTPSSLARVRRVFAANIAKRQYKGEGKFFTMCQKQDMKESWGVSFNEMLEAWKAREVQPCTR